MRSALSCLLLLLLSHCSPSMPSSDASTDTNNIDAIDDAVETSVTVRDARPDVLVPVLDPRLFDCTARMPPMRNNPIPLACLLDPTCRRPMVAGHRGAGGDLGRIAPEDTLAAYRAAIALGLDFAETDPRPTRDGVIVNVHDTTVDRTTFGTGTVSEMTLAQVQALRLRTDRFPGDFSCERIPTLRELLELCRGRVVVLVDANKTDRVDLLVQAIRDADAIDWAIFDTSSIDKIDRALAIEPRLHFMIRPSSVAEIEPQWRHFSRPPSIVELERQDGRAGSEVVHRLGGRSFTDVFGEDVIFRLNGETSGFAAAYNEGLDILQSDVPDVVLRVAQQRGR